MPLTELAVLRFNEGYSCSQAILSVFAPRFGLDEAIATKLASAFGGGMAHLDGPCGAVTGALIVLGLAKFREDVDVPAAKRKVYDAVEKLVAEFQRRNGHINCTQLLGYNLSQPEELQQAVRQQKFNEVCPKYLQDAVEILHQLLD